MIRLPGEASEKAEIPLEEAAVRLEEIRSVAAAAFLLAAGQCAMVHLCSIPRGTAETLITALAAHCRGRINHLVIKFIRSPTFFFSAETLRLCAHEVDAFKLQRGHLKASSQVTCTSVSLIPFSIVLSTITRRRSRSLPCVFCLPTCSRWPCLSVPSVLQSP